MHAGEHHFAVVDRRGPKELNLKPVPPGMRVAKSATVSSPLDLAT